MKELYEKFNCKPSLKTALFNDDNTCRRCTKDNCIGCDNVNWKEITDSKILKLEEVIIKKYPIDGINILINKTGEYICANFETFFGKNAISVEKGFKTRPEALSNLLIKLYDRFSEEERQQVKEILNG